MVSTGTGPFGEILASTGPQYFPHPTGEAFAHLARDCRDTVWGGDCYNYGLVASGHIDIVVEAGLKLHDIAAQADSLPPVVMRMSPVSSTTCSRSS